MEFYKDLYWGASLKKKKEKVLYRLEEGTVQLHLYLLVLPVQERNQLEFFDSLLLKQTWFADAAALKVAGIANGYEEAVELVQQMTEDALRETGTANIRRYLEQSWK